MKEVMMAAAFAALLGTPAFAQSPVAAPGKAAFDRETALRECSAMAGKYADNVSNMPIMQFRACMAQHGQRE